MEFSLMLFISYFPIVLANSLNKPRVKWCLCVAQMLKETWWFGRMFQGEWWSYVSTFWRSSRHLLTFKDKGQLTDRAADICQVLAAKMSSLFALEKEKKKKKKLSSGFV